MSCGLNFLKEGAKGLGHQEPLPSTPPTSPPSLTSFSLGAHRVCALGSQTGPPLHRVGRGAWGGGQGLHHPSPSPKTLAYGLDFGSRSVKLVYARGGGGLGAAQAGQHRLLPGLSGAG